MSRCLDEQCIRFEKMSLQICIQCVTEKFSAIGEHTIVGHKTWQGAALFRYLVILWSIMNVIYC